MCSQGPYFFWVLDLMRTYRRHTLIFVDYPHISLRLNSRKLLYDDAVLAILDIVHMTGHRTACIVAHSFGAFVAARLVKLHPQVRSLTENVEFGIMGWRSGIHAGYMQAGTGVWVGAERWHAAEVCVPVRV